MNIYIEFVRSGGDLSRLLRRDGWLLDRHRHAFSASHPEVPDETAARTRLYRLGILTSPAVRIEFSKECTRPVPV
jgi:hypothetical protein